MKKLTLLAIMSSFVFVAGCSPKTEQKTHEYHLPPELSDCKIFKLTDGTGNFKSILYVTRCPESNTATSQSFGEIRNSVTIN